MPASKPTWERDALCQQPDLDPDTRDSFFSDTCAERKEAKALCAACPVRLSCLSNALDRGEIWGVWGGCDEVDLRRTLWIDTNGTERERRRFPRCPACRAQTENLSLNDAETRITCVSCEFSWTAQSSIEALKIYAETVKQQPAPKVVPMRVKNSRTRQARIASGRPKTKSNPVMPISRTRASEAPYGALAASAAPTGRQQGVSRPSRG